MNGPGLPDRVVVLGTAGAGKSSLAQALAQLTGADHVDLDALYYRENWKVVTPETFRTQLRALADRPCWVADGAYIDEADRLLWPRAKLIVWLDLPLPLVVARLIRRSVLRIVRRTALWHDNRETWTMLFGRESVVVYALTSQRRARRELPHKLSAASVPGVRVVRLTRPREVRGWLAGMGASTAMRADRSP